MTDRSEARQALGRAGKRALFHLIQAAIEGLKAVEAVIEEVGRIGEQDTGDEQSPTRTRIEIE